MAENVKEAPTEPTADAEPVQLNLSDLELLASIVDLASQRGAIRTAEMVHVGTVYNKLTTFLAQVKSTQEPDAEHKE